MAYETVLYERKGRIAYITLNRPESLNAFNNTQDRETGEALDEFDADDEAWVAILSGKGRCFSAGADVKERFHGTSREERARQGGPGRIRRAGGYLANTIHWKPVIAAVHSYCLGQAMALAMECDLIVASEDARFAITEIKRGLSGANLWARAWFWTGSKVATEVALTGEHLSAQEGYRLGLVNRVTSVGQHVAGAERLAERILENPPLAVRSTVRVARHTVLPFLQQANLYTGALNLHLSEDFEESARAFVEKRKPVFTGR
ncbi:MAG: enoyl-CoA hydratase/isomerase family protein [Chloroflexi bacterium]|nr:enoyl-CoA hydratase/isomerase family protein [Chloroflexota bacterium]